MHLPQCHGSALWGYICVWELVQSDVTEVSFPPLKTADFSYVKSSPQSPRCTLLIIDAMTESNLTVNMLGNSKLMDLAALVSRQLLICNVWPGCRVAPVSLYARLQPAAIGAEGLGFGQPSSAQL